MPQSQFYLYCGTLEYLSGIWFGVYEDPEEYAPSIDSNVSIDERYRRSIIIDFYNKILNQQLIFKHYPVQFEHYFDTLFLVSLQSNRLDTTLFNVLAKRLNKEIVDSNISIKVQSKIFKLNQTERGKYYEQFNKNFKDRNRSYFTHIQTELLDNSLSDSDFFEISFDLFRTIQLNFYPNKDVIITEYSFINNLNYGNLRQYFIFFFRCYFNSELCFKNIPNSKSNYVFLHAFREDYSNLNRENELLEVFNRLNDQIK